MRIYPAIDLIDGRCVRLVQGDYAQVTVFDEDPSAVAKRWVAEGATYLHIVDLDGALKGAAHNDEALRRILRAVDVPVQIGGGIRTLEDVQAKLDMGITRCILGTVAVTDPELTRRAVAQYGEAVAVGVDAKDGKVAISGWTSVSGQDSVQMIAQLGREGVRTIVYTDVTKDGMMAGPNLPMYKEAAAISRESGVNIIAAGGVTTLEDVDALRQTGIEGAIIGKALYLGTVGLPDAIKKGV